MIICLCFVTRMKYTQPNIISLHIFVTIQHQQQQMIHFCITDTSLDQTSRSLSHIFPKPFRITRMQAHYYLQNVNRLWKQIKPTEDDTTYIYMTKNLVHRGKIEIVGVKITSMRDATSPPKTVKGRLFCCQVTVLLLLLWGLESLWRPCKTFLSRLTMAHKSSFCRISLMLL